VIKISLRRYKELIDENEKEKEESETTEKYGYIPKLERTVEKWFYRSRWLLAPMYLGLIVILVVILGKFFWDIWEIIRSIVILHSDSWITQVLDLLDLTLIANLVLIVAFSGYENFVSKINYAHEYSIEELPWMGSIDFSELKLKIIGSVVAISIIELLKDFIGAITIDPNIEFWRVLLHVIFVITGVVFARMEILESKKAKIESETKLLEKENKIRSDKVK
jgi:uncharacterized protein (TIGR00645 family)